MAEAVSSSGRPLRTTRAPVKGPVSVAVVMPSSQRRRKAQGTEKSTADKLEYLLTNARSKLTKMDISELVNYHNFLELSPESQERLCNLLPPTAFSTFRPFISPTHPDYSLREPHVGMDGDSNTMDVDPTTSPDSEQNTDDATRTPATLDPTVFTSPFLLSAARTFQDHLYSGWLAKKARDDVELFNQGVRDGTLHAEWKDEVWERDHAALKKQTVDLSTLAKRGLLKEGDVLAYKRTFLHLKLTVEKDLLIQAIHPRTHAVTVLLSPKTTVALPPSLLITSSHVVDEDVLSMEDITIPYALESGALDVDGRVSRPDRYKDTSTKIPSSTASTSANPQTVTDYALRTAWKSISVWRWNEDMENAVELQVVQDRGVFAFYVSA
ncbi:hypothetical protein A0H81_06944 [Grifola frondosa]|uniref:ASX DEUBAD domain-containing protein n=1 Tax=Grifola frondosa TaxID=5627 RepID=A0A1C7M8B7_GRIFR|nr:hypothetical protein A0H81_06944 [Grifola frondosa]